MAITRNATAEQEAGKMLSSNPGAPFYGKNFADPNVKKQYFAAINTKVYGVPTPQFGGTTAPRVNPTPQSPAQSPVANGLPNDRFVTENDFGISEKEKAYNEAKQFFLKQKQGQGGFEAEKQKQYEAMYPEINKFQQEETQQYKDLWNTRDQMEKDLEARGIIDPAEKDRLIRMAQNNKSADVMGTQKIIQQRGLTVSNLLDKAIKGYGLNTENAQLAAQLAEEDLRASTDKYAKALKQQQDETDQLIQLAFSNEGLLSGVMPKKLQQLRPDLIKQWEGASNSAKAEAAYKKQVENRGYNLDVAKFNFAQGDDARQLQKAQIMAQLNAQIDEAKANNDFAREKELLKYKSSLDSSSSLSDLLSDTGTQDNGAQSTTQNGYELNPNYSSPKQDGPMSSGNMNTNVTKIMSAIGQFESGGRYNAKGPVQKNGNQALGKYQVMASNVPSWTKAALGKSLTPAQFLADPKAQDAVARYKMGALLKQYGNVEDVASVWFSGRPVAKAGNAKDSIGTSVPKYVKNIRALYDRMA